MFIDSNRQWIYAVLLLSTDVIYIRNPKWNIMTFYKKDMMFRPFDRFIYRLPAFPLTYLRNILEGKKSMSACFSDNRVKEAVYIGSSDLYQELENYLAVNKGRGSENGIEISFMKYLSRMSTRCHPIRTICHLFYRQYRRGYSNFFRR